MPSLGNAILTLRVKGDEFKAGLSKAKTQAATTTKGIGQSFANVQKKIQGAAAKVPVFGGSLAALASPAGLAAAGIGLVVGGLTKMVGKTLDVGRRLGELREKLGVSAESIQIYERAIEEGNGKTGAFEKTTLRLQKSIGDAAGGNKAAAAEFDKLGLSFEDLQDKSPEEALRAVLGAANDTLGPTDKASVLAKTLGRSYADLGGFATKGADELTEMLDSVKDVAVTMSGDGVTAVDQYDTANRNMRDSFGSIVTEVGMALIPVLTQLFGVIKQAMPLIKTLIHVALVPVKLAVEAISTAINIVSALLRGDFTGALNFARNYFINVATIILDTGAKVVGLFNKDMAESIRGVSADLKAMKVVAETETAPALDKVATATRQVAVDTRAATGEVREYKTAVDSANDETDEWAGTMVVLAQQVSDATEKVNAQRIAIQALADGYVTAKKEAQAFFLDQIRWEGIRRKQAEDRAKYLADRDGGSDDDRPSNQSGRPAPGPRNRGQGVMDFAYDQDGVALYSTVEAGAGIFRADEYGREPEARAWISANNPQNKFPGAQHGAFVKGSQQGSLVRVGENFTDENITPVRASGSDSGQGGRGGKREYVIQIGEERVATLVLNAQNELVDTGRG